MVSTSSSGTSSDSPSCQDSNWTVAVFDPVEVVQELGLEEKVGDEAGARRQRHDDLLAVGLDHEHPVSDGDGTEHAPIDHCRAAWAFWEGLDRSQPMPLSPFNPE